MKADANNETIGPKRTINDRIGDSMLLFGIGIALFYWIFNALIRFLDSPNQDWQLILMGTEIELYEKVVVSVLFIAFGSHVHSSIKRRRQAEDNLEESEEKYRTILESIEEGYYEIDINGNFKFLNKSMCRILTRTKTEIIGTNIIDYLNPKDIDNCERLIHDIEHHKTGSAMIEGEIIIKGGGRKIIELSASLIKDAALNPSGIRGITRDITEKRMLEKNLLESLENVKEARSGVILGLAKLAEYRDSDTGRHLERIREFSRIIAREMAKLPQYEGYITETYIEDIYQSSILHDIGKVGVPDAILLKPGKLSEKEFRQIMQHSILGGQVLSTIDKQFNDQSFLTIAKEIAYYHHEKYNGTGYPSQLKGEQIPLSARIVSIADVYDALTSKRCYKDAFSHERSVTIILDKMGELFDPDVINAFLTQQEQFRLIKQKFHETKINNAIKANQLYQDTKFDL